nr:zinc finger, CCHC-type [Tanacetum cinerariifolium]
DVNPICTLGDYSKPSYEGYMNTIELSIGNNMVPLRSDTIRLVQNGCSFYGLWSEDPNQHLKDFLKLVDLLDLDGENKERTHMCLFQFSLRDQASNWLERLSAGSISTWEDLTTRVIECKVGTLMEKAISLMGMSESVFGMSSNMLCQLPPEPSRQEAFEDLVMNFIHDQEERVNTPQVLQSFKENTPPVTYTDEVEEIIGFLIEVEPLDETQLEDLGLNTFNHDIPLSSRDEPKPQPQPLRNCPSLDVSLRDERGLEPPIKPLSPDSFRMKVVDLLTIYTPPSPHLVSFHPKDTYCYYHPCIDNPQKHYGFKPGLLGHSISLSDHFSYIEMIEMIGN